MSFPGSASHCLSQSAVAVQAHSRLAALLREVGHVEGANAALERLIALPGGNAGDVQARLREGQALARRRTVTDHYKLLGLPRSASAEEVGIRSGIP